ncbi:RodZ domain-containing protein [Alkalihalobacillus sp. AL-G]|uniref:helix-turn-helix domain-containing protein n=1 Tax=Alkalihalobacillus sp. AL-G TaxID=2926399 RepID=UPI002729AEE4|nr:RodZ domain-containing protein [Alkalihalobacillus sp. AL-G]WLD95220.1 helix-turn-helix domain-containing protein [Alkalihalobacillus sp. AL-G]
MTELGQRLKEARLEKNYTFEELQDHTKIQKRYLKAIEEGDYSVLPGSFYARAFIKNYAEAVGLDPDELFEQYASDLPEMKEEPKDFAPRSSKANNNVPKENRLSKVFPFLLTILLIGALLVAFYWVYTNNNSGSGQEPNQNEVDNFESDAGEEQPEDKTTGDEPTGSEKANEESGDKPVENEKPEQKVKKVSSEGKTTTYKLTNAEEFKVEIKTKGNVYIDVKDNAGDYIQPGPKTFSTGETLNYELTDQTKVRFNIGASNNVDMTINGQPFTFPSDQVHQIIIIEYVKVASDSQ